MMLLRAPALSSLLLLALFSLLVEAEVVPSIQPNVDCHQRLSIDQALIRWDVSDDSVELFATNSYCYKCKKSLVASGNGSCAILITYHDWEMYTIQNETNNVISKKVYYFGEHGEYVVSYGDGELVVTEEKSPIDSFVPLYIVAGLVFVLIIATFALPVYKAIKECRDAEQIDEDSRLSLRSVNQALLRDSESAKSERASERKPARVMSLDTFRGFALFFMIFVNYGNYLLMLLSLICMNFWFTSCLFQLSCVCRRRKVLVL